MFDGTIRVPGDMPKTLADVLAAIATAGFTFQVEMNDGDWLVKARR